jgi:hypothetical protein
VPLELAAEALKREGYGNGAEDHANEQHQRHTERAASRRAVQSWAVVSELLPTLPVKAMKRSVPNARPRQYQPTTP